MPITDQDAVDFGFLVAFAEGMYVPNSITPYDEPRIAAAGWDVVGHFIALDSILPDASTLAAGALKSVQLGGTVFYGFLARKHSDPSRYAAAIRGTSGFAEWVIDADFVPCPTPSAAGATVELGFWSIYDSMTLVGLDGARIGVKAADGITQVVGGALVTICGHSLGSAFATYLSFDVAKLMGARASACLFASPRTGDQAWVAAFDATVATYRLINYVLDVVPYVPPVAYSTLSCAEVLQPASAQAEVRFDVRCNNNVICYCAMVDFADTKMRANAQDFEAWQCIVGRPTFGLNREQTLALATAVNALGGARDQIVSLVYGSAKKPPKSFLFVSHVSEDRAKAMEIVSLLETRGIRCWITPRNVIPGKPYDDEISDAIDDCSAVLLIFTSGCNESVYILRELTVAGDSKKLIIPFRLEEIHPKGGLRLRLNNLQWIDAFVDRETAIDQLIEVAKVHLT